MALEYLQTLPETARGLALSAEAHLLQDDMKQGRMLAGAAIDRFEAEDDEEAIAAVYIALGRGYETRGEHQTALRYFSAALRIFASHDDVFSLARAQTNLAACLIHIGNYEEANDLLLKAEAIQAKTKDRVALSTTRHNLNLLQRLQSGRHQ